MDSKAIVFHSRMVGLCYLVTTIIGLINTFLIKPKAYNFDTLLANEQWFRAAQMADLCMFALVLWMTMAIYLSIKHVNPTLAKFAFLFRFAEVSVGLVTVLVVFISLLSLKQNGLATAFSDEQMRGLYSLSLELSNVGWAMSFWLLSIGALIYFYLLHQSKGIPKWLCFWGFFTYFTLFIGFSLQLVLPTVPPNLMLVMAPGALFEFTFGCWMLVKGMRLSEL